MPASVFTTPTINGYKRYRPDSFAPDRVVWAVENRGALLRVIGEPGSPACHVENRVGDPAANPVPLPRVAGRERASTASAASSTRAAGRGAVPRAQGKTPLPGEPDGRGGRAATPIPFFTEAFGAPFVDYFTRLKEFEIARFLQHVTDWEHREYFEVF